MTAPGPRENSAIYCTIPLIRESIPLVILFRALNCVTDKLILQRICFDCPDDADMREALRASLEEAKII
jgi:DNA-directed RNA polymerase II subunit RPB2